MYKVDKKVAFLIIYLFSIHKVFSQNDSIKTIHLDSVVISDSRVSNTFSKTSRDINLISDKEITVLPAQSIPGTLSYVPGLDIRQRGPAGVQADVGIRGGSFEQTLVMIDGIKMNDPQTGHHNLNLPVPLYNIDYVEVIKGPGANRYGQDAFSGAVNFITKIPDEKVIHAGLYGGSFGLFGGDLSLALPSANIKQSISISGVRSEGYRENTDFDIGNVFYESRIPAGHGQFHLLGGYATRRFGANGFYADPSYTRQYEKIRTGLAAIDYTHNSGPITWHPRAYLRINRDDYFFVREDPSIYENLHTTAVTGAELNASWKNILGTTGLGIESRYEIINGKWTRNGEHTPSNLDGFSRKNLGFYLEQKFVKGSFDMTPGLYAGYYNVFGWNVFPGIDLGYTLYRNLRVYLNAGRAFRLPDFYDMYYDSPVEKGNPGLVPERTISYEAGTRYLGTVISAEANVFYQTSKNLIDWVQIPETDTTFYWNAKNITHISRTGLEFGMNFDLTRLANPDPWIRRIRLDYDYLFSDLKNDFRSRYVLENLKHQVIIQVVHKIAGPVYHNLFIRYDQREGEKGYWILDSRIFWKFHGNSELYFEATNWTDTKYTEVMTPMPGRWLKIGCSYDFGL